MRGLRIMAEASLASLLLRSRLGQAIAAALLDASPGVDREPVGPDREPEGPEIP